MSDFDHDEIPSSDERTWSILVHAAAFAGVVIPFGGILGPFIVWIIKKPESALVDRHGRAALNFQISMLIYAFVSALLVFVVVGILILIVLGIFWFVMVLIATIRAADGRDPGYVLAIEFLK